jgi:ATP-dependent helicase/nuclease subunit A
MSKNRLPDASTSTSNGRPSEAPSAPRLTDEQRAALETTQVSIALSAGAGCGKTFVLTQRFLANFEPGAKGALEPEQIGRLVAITFTNAAAREMRDRVRRACYERLQRSTGREAAHWSRLVRSLDAARITTIDALCSSLLRSHAVEATIDPQFTLLEPAQVDSLLVEATDEVLRERLAERDEATLELAVLFGLETLRRKLGQLGGGRHPQEFAAWRGATPEQLVARWDEVHRREVVPYVMRRISTHAAGTELVDFLEHCQPTDEVVKEQRQTILATMSAWRGGKVLGASAADDLARLRASAMTKRRTPKAWPAPEDYELFRDLSGKFRAQAIDKLSSQLNFDPKAALPIAQIGMAMLELAIQLSDRYAAAKTAVAALDFHDLLSRAHAMLSAPEHAALRKRLADQIQLLLVDEFQDTDSLQVDLIRALCGDDLERGKLFFVGDYKQSIYRFRGANPQVFRSLRDNLPAAGRLSLTLNFRSQPAILSFVNALFAKSLGPDYEPLRPHRAQRTPTPAVEFLWALSDDASPGDRSIEGANSDNASAADTSHAPKESADDIRRREADWIARRLRGMIDAAAPIVCEVAADRQGEEQTRPVRYGDIAILFRALSDVAHYEEALRKYGLPYYLVGGHAFYAQQEIFDLTNLLRGVNDPADVVSLAGALRSPFFSLTDETLYWLAKHPDGLSAGLMADSFPAGLAEEEQRRAAFAAKILAELRSAKDRVSITTLINLALERTGYDALLLAEFLGERKLANLQKLVELARGFERDGLFKLSEFIGELAGQVSEQPKEALAATHGAGMEVVRLMSVHQSKGLEFPVVVVVDVDRPANTRLSGVEFSRELGPLVKMPADSGFDEAVGGYELFQLLAGEEDEAEVNRLFYVAATRAADYLIISSGLATFDRLQGPWLKLLASRFDLTTGALRGETDFEAPSVKVTTTRPVCGSAAGAQRHVDWRQVVAAGQSAATAEPSGELKGVAPVPVAHNERRLFSFSRLSGALYAIERDTGWDDDGPLPDQSAASNDARGLGTLVHAALAELRFPASPDDIASLVHRHAAWHVEPGSDDVKLAIEMIERFAKSKRAAELAAAKSDLVETEFLLAWPLEPPREPAAVASGVQAEARRLQIWGFIDRLVENDAGEWTIVDFKTNRVPDGSIDAFKRQYELQILVYAAAVEQALGKPPKSLTLYLLRSGTEVRVEWNAAQRKRLIQSIDQAIQRVIAK